MLIDDILSADAFPGVIARFPMLRDLRSATPFVMTADALAAASHLTTTAASSTSIIEQFRLPYPHCWIEAAKEQKQIGWYIDWRAEEILVLKFRRFDNITTGITAAGIFSPDTLEFLPKKLNGRCFFIECEPLPVMEQIGEHAFESLADAALKAMSLVAIINSPAISTVEDSDLARLNKRRLERGKEPLLDHHTICIRPGIAKSLKINSDTDHDSKKLHWRRGHFKSLTKKKSGLYWWKPHLAGIKGEDPANKKYIVTNK